MPMDKERRRVAARIGASIRAIRTRNKVPQSALATALDISFQMMQKYESGVSPIPADRLIQVSEALSTSIEDVLDLPPSGRFKRAVDTSEVVLAKSDEEKKLLSLFQALESVSAQRTVLNLLTLLADKSRR